MLDKITKGAISPRHATADMAAYRAFQTEFDQWIHSSKQKVSGLPETRVLVSGITDALNQTYALYQQIGVFDGEYGYHSLVLGNRVTKMLSAADAIVVSHPFSADGMSSHDKLKQADCFGKPIFVDCAFFGICANVDFDFASYNNIHSVCFSLSKTFGTGHRRIGMLYTRDRYAASVYDEWSYPLIASAEHHYRLLKTIGPDDTFERLRSAQESICVQLNVEPSDTVIFGIDRSNLYPEYKRGQVGRLCISQLLQDGQ